MKSRKHSFDWMLVASAGIFFLLGRFIAPRYETMLLTSGAVDEVTPISTYSLFLSGFLLLCFIGRWIYRWKNRGKL